MKLSDKKRQQIVLASVQEFRDQGFNGTSMDNVAQRAEVSKRTVYNHFSSKEALFSGIVEYMFGLIAETAPAPYDNQSPFEAQLMAIAEKKIALFSSDEFLDLSRVALPEAILHPEKMKQAMTQMANIESDMERWFKAAIDDNKIQFDSAEHACEQFMGLVKLDAYWPRIMKGKSAPNTEDREKMALKAVGMFLSYFAVAK